MRKATRDEINYIGTVKSDLEKIFADYVRTMQLTEGDMKSLPLAIKIHEAILQAASDQIAAEDAYSART